jgi:hypothetical protein
MSLFGEIDIDSCGYLIGTSPASNLSRYITSNRASDIVNDHTNTNAKLAV